MATERLTLGDTETVEPGDLVYLMLADANRDPDHFARGSIDLPRTPESPSCLRHGRHPLPRRPTGALEGRIVLDRLRPLLPELTARSPADWSPVRLLRQRNTLHLTF